MNRMNLLNLFTVVLLGTVLASAQAPRTWVSGVGDDVNPCSRTAPCKTFAGAISRTAAGGEIDALDPGGFGAVTIVKAITIDGGGGQVASVLVNGTNGIVVQAGASDVVILRNLRINGIVQNPQGGGGINGIRWTSGKTLHIENCVIFGFNNNGIDIAKGDGGNAAVINTIVENNANAGLKNENSSMTVNVSIDRSQFEGNQFGIWSGSFSKITTTNSDASGGSYGFITQSGLGTSENNISNTTANNDSAAGVASGGGATASTVRIIGVTLFNDGTGLAIGANGSVLTGGGNSNPSGGAPGGPYTVQ